MNAPTIKPQPVAPEIRELHLNMARAFRNAWLSIRSVAPKAAKNCRDQMHAHALKARGKVV